MQIFKIPESPVCRIIQLLFATRDQPSRCAEQYQGNLQHFHRFEYRALHHGIYYLLIRLAAAPPIRQYGSFGAL
jgi:hypothetical protein